MLNINVKLKKMKKAISAEIIADSVNPQGDRITSYILTYPRFIHGELMTHRMFSRNSASSRAIPFNEMVKSIQEDPFIPIAWQKGHVGMQGTEYITDKKIIDFKTGIWLQAKDEVIHRAQELHSDLIESTSINNHKLLEGTGVTKQICNRLLEPFAWHTVLVTATEYDNFFNLRCPKYKNGDTTYFSKNDYLESNSLAGVLSDSGFKSINTSQAEIHIQALAEAMWDAKNEFTPKELKAGEYHIPFGDKMQLEKLSNIASNYGKINLNNTDRKGKIESTMSKVAVARCARLSYMTFDGKIDYEADIKLHDRLLKSKHASPFEHVARAVTDEEYYSQVKGKVPTRKDDFGIINCEYYPAITGSEELMGMPIGINKNNGDRFGWFDNFKGFQSYRHILEN